MANTDTPNRLQTLQLAIRTAQMDGYLVPMVDEFQGEYIPASAARLPYLTGFTGSAGMGVFWAEVSETRQHTLFVDGRYTIQAANEVDGALIHILNSGEVTLTDYVAKAAAGNALRLGVDPWLLTARQFKQWSAALADAGVTLVSSSQNLVDGVWGVERPAAPAGAVQLHGLEFAGESYATKRARLLEMMARRKADALVLTLPDGVNWLLNIRGADIPFNPLLLAYLVLKVDGTSTLYTNPHDFSAEVKSYFAAENVVVADIAEVFNGTLSALNKGARVLMDEASPQGWFALAEQKGWQVIAVEDPTELPKAIKNNVEREGIRAAHCRDGLALSKFLHWFDARVSAGQYPDELTVVARLEEFRAADNAYRGASFATIAGSGPHGAIVHYRADEASNRRTKPGELFLLDSGGQYADGTTDVTRTLYVPLSAKEGKGEGAISNATAEHKEARAAFTYVLKGHIALAAATFPAGTSGSQLDVLARQYLWEAGLDYDHGTGHGVGAFLCVHEGPQRISKRGSAVPLVEGMILSNEPGYYKAGHFGIRIENLVMVVAAGTMADGKPRLSFETVTLAPIDTRLVEVSMLTTAERNWLNAYHQRVYKAHEASLTGDAKVWLMNATRAI